MAGQKSPGAANADNPKGLRRRVLSLGAEQVTDSPKPAKPTSWQTTENGILVRHSRIVLPGGNTRHEAKDAVGRTTRREASQDGRFVKTTLLDQIWRLSSWYEYNAGHTEIGLLDEYNNMVVLMAGNNEPSTIKVKDGITGDSRTEPIDTLRSSTRERDMRSGRSAAGSPTLDFIHQGRDVSRSGIIQFPTATAYYVATDPGPSETVFVEFGSMGGTTWELGAEPDGSAFAAILSTDDPAAEPLWHGIADKPGPNKHPTWLERFKGELGL